MYVTQDDSPGGGGGGPPNLRDVRVSLISRLSYWRSGDLINGAISDSPGHGDLTWFSHFSF